MNSNPWKSCTLDISEDAGLYGRDHRVHAGRVAHPPGEVRPQDDGVVTAGDEGEVVNVSPDLALVREEDLVMSQFFILAGIQQSFLQIWLESLQTPNIVVASDHKNWPDVHFPEYFMSRKILHRT